MHTPATLEEITSEALQSNLQSTSQEHENVVPHFLSGKPPPSDPVKSVVVVNQNHDVLDVGKNNGTEHKIVGAADKVITGPANLTPSTDTDFNVNNTVSLSSALQSLNILGGAASTSKDQIIQGPFEVVGQASIISPNEISGLQLVDADGVPLQIPVQVLTNSGENGQIHMLSLKIDDTSTTCSAQEVLQITDETKTNGEERKSPLSEPCRSSTPAMSNGKPQ